MKSYNLYFLITILISITSVLDSFSQYQNVRVSSINWYFPYETSLMINPKNPNQIVAGSNIVYFSSDTSLCGYYYSTNGGYNWVSGVLHNPQAKPSSDPVIIVDTAGNYYFISCGNWSFVHWFDRILVMKSTNGGMNWASAETFGLNGDKVQDKPWGCVDWSNSIYRNNMYVTWTEFSKYQVPEPDSSIILFTKSTNNGLNWSQPLRISKRKGDAESDSNTMLGAIPCVGPGGEIYTAWSGPIFYDSQYAIFFNKSTDGGNTWLDSEQVVANQYGGWCFNVLGMIGAAGLPAICSDLSNGPYRGSVYINFSDQRNGPTDTDVWLIKSTNGGMNWSFPKRVNDDPPGKHQFQSWMCIDQTTGYLYFVFYDQRNLSGLQANVYVARSTDGGETFQNVKVSSSTFNLSTTYPMGDYNGIDAVNGHIRPIWTRAEGSALYIYTAIMDTFVIGIQPINNMVPKDYFLYQNYPNPFNPNTSFKIDIPKSTLTRLIVYDILGREVTTLVNERLKPGSYEVEWDGSNYPSGVYFYRLTTEYYSETKKMVLIK